MKVCVLNGKNQIFLTEQGEGPTQGRPAVFLRLSGCNLFCYWCDTDYTWNWQGTLFKHQKDSQANYKKFDKKQYQTELTLEQILGQLEELQNTPRLVVTGGEPLLQEANLLELFKALRSRYNDMSIEIETNGTKAPSRELIKLNVQFNVSPKLSNSKIPKNLRIKPTVLTSFVSVENSIFKFVIIDREDIKELEQLIQQIQIPNEKIWLMPCATTTEELDTTSVWVKEEADYHNWNFTDRLQIRKNIP
ncbi:MAG: 7-carboxy-7-deazaguanine synthase QueE [Bdellovibrionales bacterium]